MSKRFKHVYKSKSQMHVKYHIVKSFVFNLKCCPTHLRHNESIPVCPFMNQDLFLLLAAAWLVTIIFSLKSYNWGEKIIY